MDTDPVRAYEHMREAPCLLKCVSFREKKVDEITSVEGNNNMDPSEKTLGQLTIQLPLAQKNALPAQPPGSGPL